MIPIGTLPIKNAVVQRVGKTVGRHVAVTATSFEGEKLHFAGSGTAGGDSVVHLDEHSWDALPMTYDRAAARATQRAEIRAWADKKLPDELVP